MCSIKSVQFTSLPSAPFFPLEVGPLKYSLGVWGSAVSSPSGNRISCMSALKSDIWWHQITSFPENQLCVHFSTCFCLLHFTFTKVDMTRTQKFLFVKLHARQPPDLFLRPCNNALITDSFCFSDEDPDLYPPGIFAFTF